MLEVKGQVEVIATAQQTAAFVFVNGAFRPSRRSERLRHTPVLTRFLTHIHTLTTQHREKVERVCSGGSREPTADARRRVPFSYLIASIPVCFHVDSGT